MVPHRNSSVYGRSERKINTSKYAFYYTNINVKQVYQLTRMDPRDAFLRPVDHRAAHRAGRRVLSTGDGHRSTLTALAAITMCCRKQTDDNSLFTALVDDERVWAKIFKVHSLGEISQGSTLIIGDFLVTQCGTGRRKPLGQNELDPFGRFDTIPACDRHTDRETQARS